MISSFNDFIRESNETSFNQIVSRCVKDVMSLVKKSNFKDSKYIKLGTIEYLEPLTFDLIIVAKKEISPNFEKDSHFKNLSWEKINFDEHGFSIDGNTFTDKDELIVPEIEITILMNPEKIPNLYSELYYKLNDIIAHEVHHLTQLGWNRLPFRVRPSSNTDRANSKKSFKYFLLSDEVESMVKGMYRRAKLERKPIDLVFHEYLEPFLKENYISKEEYDQVLFSWISYAYQNYPTAVFSDNSKKIIDSL